MTIDFVQEVRAQNAVETLRRSVAVQAKVRRSGVCLSVPIDRLVPGDIVELIAGDLVPADSRLLESRDLFINQALVGDFLEDGVSREVLVVKLPAASVQLVNIKKDPIGYFKGKNGRKTRSNSQAVQRDMKPNRS